MPDPRAEYTRRVSRCDAEIAIGDRRHQLVANLRLMVAGAGALAIWLVWTRPIAALWLLAPLVAFVALVVVHDRILKRTERSRRARRLYERGFSRLDGTWMGQGADGARFEHAAAFARDLDLFGSGSLFQLLNTARTEVGEEALAAWLTRGADPAEIRARQLAVDELRPMADFREELAVTAADVHVGKTGALGRWAAIATPGIPSASLWLFGALSAITVLLIVAMFTSSVSVRLVFWWFLAQVGVATLWTRRAGEAVADIDEAASDLSLLKMLLERIEGQPFSSPRLAALREALPAEGQLASRRIAGLQRLVTALDSCSNPMVSLVAKFLQIPAHLMIAIARWRTKHGHAIAEWLRVVGEVEALSALATFAFEHPADPFPEIDAAAPLFDATDLAHPLIHEAVAIPNDVRLGGGGPHVLIVSGSNMSGKSTLLRAVGVNVVLAMCGAPVRAARLRLSPLAIGASIRVEDSLQSGESRFYAEILRIRAIVDLARGPVPALFLLDEILGGTNSFDRRIGAEAIVRGLAASGAIGLVTTHDLALTELVPALGAPAANVHFEDRIEDGKMIFDYRMRPGVVERSNALALMRAIGLDV